MPRNRANRAYADALARWETACRDLPPRTVERTRRLIKRGLSGRLAQRDRPLFEIVHQLIKARDECPGDSQWWQHSALLAAWIVRTAKTLCPQRKRKKARKN